jgi:hypothetical protein
MVIIKFLIKLESFLYNQLIDYTKIEGPNEMELHRLTSSKQTSIAIIAVESDILHLM